MSVKKFSRKIYKRKWLFVSIFVLVLISVFLNDDLKDVEQTLQNNTIERAQNALLSKEAFEKKMDEKYPETKASFEKVLVKRVVDGDTIVLDDDRRVRYIGVDTPETKHPNKDVECFGQDASERNTQIVEGKEVYLEKDVSDTDRYGRLLRYIWLSESDTVSVNEMLIAQGYALAKSYPPDVKYQEKMTAAQQSAQENNLGLWGVCELE